MSAPVTALPSNPDTDAGPRILGATLTTTFLGISVVATRIYVRKFIIRAPGLDDLVMLIALALSIAGEVFVVLQVNNGGGRHIGDVDPISYGKGLHYNFITQPIYLWAICMVKISVGFALLRIAGEKRWQVIIYSIMIFMSVYTFGCFLTIILQCKHLAALWDPTVPLQCWTKQTLQALSFTNVALNILTDFTFAVVIPIPMLWKLQVNTRTKVSIMVMLALGLFACAAAIVKIPSLVNYGKQGDFLWDSRDITIWTITECNIGIIAGSMPALKPLAKPILGSSYLRRITAYASYGKGSQQKSGRHEYLSSRASNYPGAGSKNRDEQEDVERQSTVVSNPFTDQEPISMGVISKSVTATVTIEEGRRSSDNYNYNSYMTPWEKERPKNV